MSKCDLCTKRRAEVYLKYAGLKLCPECFIQFFRRRIQKIIEEYKMFKKNEKIGVAISGGKDSSSLLHTLKNIYPKQEFTAFHINLGITGYSDHCEEKARELARQLDVELVIYNLKNREGYTIEDFERTKYSRKMCSTCGVIKRHVMNVMACEANVDVLATGHNLDDTVETMFSTFISGDFKQLIRLKPVLPSIHPKLKKKVKPLIKIPEVENLLYASYNNLPIRRVNCRYSESARSIRRKRLINKISDSDQKFKYQLLSVFLKKLIPMVEKEKEKVKLVECKLCGYPSLREICSKCVRTQVLLGT